MKQTIAAVFDDTVTARRALDDLLSAGFGRDTVQLSGNGVASAQHDPASTRDLFSTLFGRDDTRAETYMTAVTRGNCVLTLTLDAADIARAEAVLDRHHPLSLDEHAADITAAPWMGGEERQGEMAPSMGRETTGTPPQQVRPRPQLGARFGLDEGLGRETADFGEGYSADMGMITEGQGLRMNEPPMTRLIWPRRPMPAAMRVPLADEHEESFRAHHASEIGDESAGYDDYAHAYRYGAAMSRDEQLGGRDWHEAEPELRSRWDRHEDSSWLRFKEAIRHGWDRLRHH
jgi:hypothetical protein